MTILVTGATGFVGAAVARRLLAARIDVRVLVRPQSDRHNLEGLAVTTVTGDLADPASLDKAVAGCSGLYHVAADYRLWVKDPAAMYRANVDGTRALLQAAGRAGVERVVYTSSVATLGTHADGTPASEETTATLDDMIGHYKRSKFMAEQAVDELAAGGLPGGHRQPVHAGRTGRHQAHSHGPHDRGCAHGPHAGLRGHGSQYRARR